MKRRACSYSLCLAVTLADVSAAAPDYLVTAAPLTLGAPNGEFCVAIDPADPRGVWWWEPGASGCSTRSTGPGVFHADAASIAKSPDGGTTEVRFRVALIPSMTPGTRGTPIDVLLLLKDHTLRSASSGSEVSIVNRKNLEVPGFDGAPDASARRADTIPANVMSTLTGKFPQAKIDKWSKEKEDGKVVYDIEFRQGERKFEADIFADGTIHNWEQQIAQNDLPAAVAQAVTRRFPNAVLKEIMAVTEVKNGAEQLEGYEIVVQRGHRKDVEMTIAPDGKILEGPGKQK